MIYDHERESTAPGGRSIADWGGDDLFTSVPRRRFVHGASRPRAHAAAPAVSHGARRGAMPAAHRTAESPVAVLDEAPFAVLDDPAPAVLDAAPSAVRSPVRMPEPLPLVPVSGPSAGPAAATGPESSAAGRRTVTITGRPGATATPVRRRPRPTVHDRVGSRPDRIAGWAFLLGLILILVAIAV